MKTKLIPFDIEKAKDGAKVVTRDGHKVDTIRFDGRDSYPISGWIRASQLIGDSDEYASFTKEGYYISSNNEDCRDLFIEEDVGEDDDYNPYKEVVKSISDMVERYSELQSLEELKHFYNNVKVKCREAVEYEKIWRENQDEKPANNKPKFQEGDWTIQDAKPGDILASKNGLDILIFKELDNRISFSSYYNIRGRGEYYWTRSNFIPATKEQCDRLFKKMKEAGYEWDFDKKELHKIGEVKTRRMTNQELSWWLQSCPEEHREITYSNEDNYVSSYYSYLKHETNKTVDAYIRIRKNGGEWQEPLLEI